MPMFVLKKPTKYKLKIFKINPCIFRFSWLIYRGLNFTLDDILEAELHDDLMTAIEQLQPQQKELLIRVYWKKELQKDIAAEQGVSEVEISGRMKRTIDFLKRF